jgi:hypothetical protein
MSDQNIIPQEALELIKEVYPDFLKPAMKELGFGLHTIVESLMRPLLRLKYSNIKAKALFALRVKKLFSELSQIPDTDRTELPASIAVPVIEQLSFESDEDISDLYINLLTKAASESAKQEVHPSFINALKNMSNDEAKIIEYFNGRSDIPYLLLRLQFNEKEGLDKSGPLTGIENEVNLHFPGNIPIYCENFISLGVLANQPGSLSDTKKWYEPLKEGYKPLIREVYDIGHTDGKKYEIAILIRYYRITHYGQLFIKACLKKYNRPD